MRIGIDARMYGTANAGLGRYTEKLIHHLEKIDLENEYVIFLLAENFDSYKPKNKNFKKVIVKSRWYTLKENWQMPREIRKHQIDLMHFPHFNVPWLIKVPYVVTIHDLIMTHYPDSRATTKNKLVYWLKIKAYQAIIKRAARNAEKIITVSDFSKQDIIKNLGVTHDKIEVTYEGFNLPERKDSNIDLGKWEIKKPYLLYVGKSYPHKNLEKLVEAFKNLDRNVQLVLVGKEDFFAKRLKNKIDNLGLGQKIIMTGYVSDEELSSLYQDALAFVFSSLLEGFGLPPLEAMGQGLPVVSSSASCLPEILGDAVLYFDPRDNDDIIDKLAQIIDNADLREKLIQQGYEKIKKYGWEKCAKETLDIYREAKRN